MRQTLASPGPVKTDQEAGLAALLRQEGAYVDLPSLKEMLPGILAAPRGERAEAWMALVADDPSPALRASLAAFRAAHEADGDKEPDAGETDAGPMIARLAAVRAELKKQGLAGFLIGRADEHQGEYVPKGAERLAYVTGFSGSAGLAIVLLDKAAIFVDGRYTIQVRQQVDAGQFQIRHLTDEPPEKFIEANLPPGSRLGFDPRLLTPEQTARYRKAAKIAKAEFVAAELNPVDAVWKDQPPAPLSAALPHVADFAGRSSAEKRQELAARLAEAGQDAAIVSAPDSLCWLLNIRGADTPRTPFALGFAILHRNGHVDLFMDGRKLVPATLRHLGNEVSPQPPEAFGAALESLGRAGAKVALDSATASQWIEDRLKQSGAEIQSGDCICALPKACKNATEIEGARRAHRRDGAALSDYLAWIAQEAPKGNLSEIEASDHLARLRARNKELRDLSFDSISAAGPNSAICHYKATPESNRLIEPNSLYLIDSGGQYADGTTDITRTLAVGAPSREMKECFTRVLKGHIALATARFPAGTTGSQLDALARRPLWDAGLDFDHGTGHGVGSYLSVHEGPQRISKMPNRTALKPGMIVSNEPGFYKHGAFGIRIENLVLVRESPDYKSMLEFETLTLAPIDLTCVEPALLDEREKAWLNAYHARVRAEMMPLIDAANRDWLTQATRAI